MEWTGNLRKLRIGGEDEEVLRYFHAGADILEPLEEQDWGAYLGRKMQIEFAGQINCVQSGKRIRKTYGDGLSYDAWLKAPQTVESVIRPELSRIHEGIALRDRAWEEANHNVPHWVYLAQTSNIKVGVTGVHTGHRRWFDQGAIAGTVLCVAPYRGLAGEMEVLLKDVFSDKSAYRGMILAQNPDEAALDGAREEAFDHLGTAFEDFMQFNAPIETFRYPTLELPKKVHSIRLDKQPTVEGRLVGLKGQYLVFDTGEALNIRSHIGYRVQIRVS